MPLTSDNFLEATIPVQGNFLEESIADTTDQSFMDATVEEIDPKIFFDQRRASLLSNVGMEFGGDREFGRTTSQLPRGIWNLFDTTPDTDFGRLHNDLEDLLKTEPELAATPEGKAYIDDIRQRARSVLDMEEMGIGQMQNAHLIGVI